MRVHREAELLERGEVEVLARVHYFRRDSVPEEHELQEVADTGQLPLYYCEWGATRGWRA